MVFEPNFMRVASSVRKNIGITQSVVELKLPTNEDFINNIFSIGAKSTIVNSEVSGREVNFWGLIDFQAVYESQGVSAIDYTAEFKDKFVSNEEVVGEIILTSNIVDVNSSAVANGIRVVAIVETTIDAIETKDINVLSGVKGENVYVSTKEISFSTYIGKATEKFDNVSDFEIDNVEKILIVTPNVCLHNVDAKENYVNVSGIVNVSVCYLSSQNVNDIRTKTHVVDFSYEVALDGINSDSCIQSAISIITNEIKVSTSLEEGNATINLFVPILYSGYVFNQKTMDVVDDVYSQSNYLSVTSEEFSTIKCCGVAKFRDTVSGTASILDTAPFIDEILGVSTNNIVLASSEIIEDRLSIEGVANATVLYYTKETDSITSVQVEMPFVVEEKVDADESKVVSLCLEQLSARSKRGKEIEVSAELNVYSDLYYLSDFVVITNVLEGEEKEQDDCSLYIYIVKPNETIWDIAKNMNVSTDLILEQNPNVELPIKANDRLVIYKPKIVNL